MSNNMVCIICPKACKITIEEDNNEYKICGNKCQKGREYVLQEIKNPIRIFTSTVGIDEAPIKRLPVRSRQGVPKDSMEELAKKVRFIKVTAPVKKGDVVVKNILGFNVDIIASRTVKKIN